MIYALIVGAIGLAAVAGGAYFTGTQNEAEKQKAYYEPKVARATADKDIALAKNKELIDERAKVTDAINQCNLATAAARADTAISIAMMDKLNKESQDRVRQFASIQARFDAAARTVSPVPRDLSCEAARATLAEYSDQAHILDAIGLGKAVTTPFPAQPTLTISPGAAKAPPKSAIKTLEAK